MNIIATNAEDLRMRAERARARGERERDAARAVIDEEKRRKATTAKTIRLREQRLVREALEREAAAAAEPVPAKKARRRSAISAVRPAVADSRGGAGT
jgi:hypothetical protein